MRVMDDFVRGRADAQVYAHWESNLYTKDKAANRRRLNTALNDDVSSLSQVTKISRTEKLKKLYAADENIYEQELLAMNLTFRREKI